MPMMNRDIRHHAVRRTRAIEQLGSITTAAALAGVAGTVGFGFAAAASFSGTKTAADTPSVDLTLPRTFNGGDESDDQPAFGQDFGSQNYGSQDFGAAPAPRSRSGGGHATTGGSG